MAQKKTPSGNNDSALKKLEEARFSNDRFQKYARLKEAAKHTQDESLLKDIEDERAALHAENERDFREQFALLSDTENYEDFVSALRYFEEWLKVDYEFKTSEKRDIQEARKWLNDKRTRDGAGISAVMIGDLQTKYKSFEELRDSKDEKYNEYYLNVEEKLTYEQYLVLIRKEWERESSIVCGKILFQAFETARTSPAAARTFLRGVMQEDEKGVSTKNFGEPADYPFNQPEIEKIKRYLSLLDIPCRQEEEAWNLKKQSFSAVTPFEKYELLLRVRELGWVVPSSDDSKTEISQFLPGIDREISAILPIAESFRVGEISRMLHLVEERISELPKIGKENILVELDSAQKQLNDIYGGVILWPGQGLELQLSVNGKTSLDHIAAPKEFDAIKQGCNHLLDTLPSLRQAIERFLSQDETIRELLSSSNESQREDGARAFKRLKDDQLISRLLIFEDLQGFKTQQTGFDDAAKDILELVENEKWSSVLDQCRVFVLKPGYKTRCPDEIKQNIEKWKLDSIRKLKLLKFQALVEKKNFSAAKRIWLRSRNEGVDWNSVSVYLDEVKRIDENGVSLIVFYDAALREFNLGSEHILLKILRDKDDVYDSREELDVNEAIVMKAILGESKGQFSSEQFDTRMTEMLRKHLGQVSLEKKLALLEKIRYVAGFQMKYSIASCPPYTVSLAEFEAGMLAHYLAAIVREEAVESLAVIKPVDAGILIESIHRFDLPLSGEQREQLKAIEIAHTQLKAEEATSEQVFQLWRNVLDHFAGDVKIAGKHNQARRAWYVDEIKKLRLNSKFDEALKLITKAMEDVGAIWQIALERAHVCLEINDFATARKAINEVLKSRKLAEIVEFDVMIDLKEKSVRHEGDSLAYMNSLVTYWKMADAKIKGAVVERTIQREFEVFSQGYIQVLNEKIRNSERDQAWKILLDLMNLEDVYLQVNESVSRASDVFVDGLIPSLYPTGKKLAMQSGEFIRELTDPRIKLYDCISDGERIHASLVSYESVLAKKYINKSEKVTLNSVVREIVNKHVHNPLRKREFLLELEGYVNEDEDEPIMFSTVSANRLRIWQVLETQLYPCHNKLDELTKASLWLDCSSSTLKGGAIDDAWKALDDGFRELRDYGNFLEVARIRDALADWKSALPQAHTKYNILQDKISDESFQEALDAAQQLETILSQLSPFSFDDSAYRYVVNELKNMIEVENSYRYGSQQEKYFSLTEVQQAINVLLSEIGAWLEVKNSRKQELSDLSDEVNNYQRKVADYNLAYYDPHHRFLKSDNSDELFNDYFKYVAEMYKKEDPNIGRSNVWQRPRVNTLPVESQRLPAAKTELNGVSATLLSMFGKKVVQNPIKAGLAATQEVKYPIVEQEAELRRILASLADRDLPSLPARSLAAENLKIESHALVNQIGVRITEIQNALGKIANLRSKVRYPDQESIKKDINMKQYSNAAKRIIGGALVGVGEEDEINRRGVETFREILLHNVNWS